MRWIFSLFRRRPARPIAPMMGGSLAGRLLYVNHMAGVAQDVAQVPRHKNRKVWR